MLFGDWTEAEERFAAVEIALIAMRPLPYHSFS